MTGINIRYVDETVGLDVGQPENGPLSSGFLDHTIDLDELVSKLPAENRPRLYHAQMRDRAIDALMRVIAAKLEGDAVPTRYV